MTAALDGMIVALCVPPASIRGCWHFVLPALTESFRPNCDRNFNWVVQMQTAPLSADIRHV